MQILDKIKLHVEEFFPIKTFILSFASLLLALISSVIIHQIFFAEAAEDTKLTGKVMAEILVTTVQPEAIPEPPKPVEKVSHPEQTATEQTLDPDAILEGAHPTPSTSTTTEATERLGLEDSIAGLSEETSFGSLPIIRVSDKLKSFEAYKTPFVAKATTKGVITLVMIDFGLSDNITKSMVEELPREVTFAASPYSQNLQPKISYARKNSFEVWLNLPIESDNLYVGQNAILSGLTSKENLSRLNTNLGKATGYAGVTVNGLSQFPDASPDLQILTNSIASRGLGIAQLSPKDNILARSASAANAPFIQSQTWIDAVLTKEDILKSLESVEKISLDNGVAVATFRPSLFTASIIKEWVKSLEGKNLQLAPLTYSAKMNFSAPAPTTSQNDN